MAFKRTFREEFSLFFEIPAIISLAVLGLILLPIVGPFCLCRRGQKINKGGHYDQKEG